MKSFLGMAQQLTFFMPNFSHSALAMRQLLGKGKTFQRLPEHEEEFNNLKNLLSTSLLTKHYNPKKSVTLLTDASRQHGIGFALCQEDNHNRRVIITCGSKSLTPTQQRYATIELECLAIIMWVIRKCEFYLK